MKDIFKDTIEKKNGMQGEYISIKHAIRKFMWNPKKITWFMYNENDKKNYSQYVDELVKLGVKIEVAEDKQLTGLDFEYCDPEGNHWYVDSKARFDKTKQDAYFELNGQDKPYGLRCQHTNMYMFVLADRQSVEWVEMDKDVLLTIVNDSQYNAAIFSKNGVKALVMPFNELKSKIALAKGHIIVRNPILTRKLIGKVNLNNYMQKNLGVKVVQTVPPKRVLKKDGFAVTCKRDKQLAKVNKVIRMPSSKGAKRPKA